MLRILTVSIGCLCCLYTAMAQSQAISCWNPDDIRAGMKGTGLTVMHGTRIDTFQVEILGVMKNTAPGRDMILARLSGLDLEKTGVIAGMSGSPVSIDGKLVGAVAYAWQFGKEPIAGITPFTQMYNNAEARNRLDTQPARDKNHLGFEKPLRIGGHRYDTLALATSPMLSGQRRSLSTASHELWLTPLQTPVACSGFSPHSLKLFQEEFGQNGLQPVLGGAIPARIAEEEKSVSLEPGSSLCLAMITGDFDMSGIGTVTCVDGDRVYGWGHPFMSLGACEFPMMTGYVHTVYPRQTVSFKMGSPLRSVGIVNTDVSTCIAGWIGRKPDMIPAKIVVQRESGSSKSFQVQIVRQKNMFGSLAFAALTNAIDMEGDLPEEMTAELTLTIEIEGQANITIHDTFSGASIAGGRAPSALYLPLAQLLSNLANNPLAELRIQKFECSTLVKNGRSSAEIEAIELARDVLEPGATLEATVTLRPYKGNVVRQTIQLPLPKDMQDGQYTLTVADDMSRARNDLRDRPDLSQGTNLRQYLQALRTLTAAQRTYLSARVPIKPEGVALEGQCLPDLPPGMVQLLGQSRRTGVQYLAESISSRLRTNWVIIGYDTASFKVAAKRNLIEGGKQVP